jgi:hypothetical protein
MKSTLFYGRSLHEFMTERQLVMEREIEETPIENLRGDADELARFFVQNHTPSVPVLTEPITADQPETNLHSSRVKINLRVPFDGDAIFFGLSPSTAPVIENTCGVHHNHLVLEIHSDMNQMDKFKREKVQLVGRISECLDRIRQEVHLAGTL